MIWENIGLAFQSLKSNKMRALLTMLGIIIGIMSIIGIMTIGDALTASVSGSLSSLGTNNITLSVQERGTQSNGFGPPGMGGDRGSSSGKTPESDDLITDQMIADLTETFGGLVTGVSISYSAGSAKAQDGDLYANITISGVNANYGVANNVTQLSGSFIAESDVENKSQSAVVSDKFVKNMFPNNENPIGQTVKVYKTRSIELYTIIGVYQYEQQGFGGSTASEKDMSTTFYIPVTTAKQDLLEKNYNTITVIGSASSDVDDLTNQLQRHFDRLYANNEDWQVSVSNMSSMLDTVQSTLSTISIAIAFIAGISLLVGGIGVMNIMLVSVTERTKEIGTRKALGAQNYHIQLQFVMEAVMVSAIGGVIGLLLGIGVGALVSSILSAPLVISAVTTIGSVLFSMAIGVVFGLYPARKAARMDPIDALRYE